MRGLQRDFLHQQLAVGLDCIAGTALRRPGSDLFVEGTREEIEAGALERQTGRHGVAAELADELRMPRVEIREHIADMNAWHGARRAAQLPLARDRKGDHGPADAVFDTAGDQPDDALMPALIEETDAAALQGAWAWIAQATHRREGLRLHARLDRPPLMIELIETRGERGRRPDVVGEQALDSHGHVIQASGRIEPWRDAEREIGGDEALERSSRDLE